MTTTKQVGWLAVLNALAGTSNLGAAAAACKYAGIAYAPPALDVLGALNIKAGYGHNPSGWQGMGQVCNKIAGTTGLEPLAALQHAAGLT